MKEYRYFVLTPVGKEYRYSFPAACPQCGKPTTGTTTVGVGGMIGVVRRAVGFQVPYCREHLQLIRTFTWVKDGLYLLSFLITFAALLLVVSARNELTLNVILVVAGISAALWLFLIAPMFRWLLVKPLMSIVDAEQVFECDTNTLSFTARMDLAQVVFGFANPAVAELFAQANAGDPKVEPLEESFMLTKFPAFLQAQRKKQKQGATPR